MHNIRPFLFFILLLPVSVAAQQSKPIRQPQAPPTARTAPKPTPAPKTETFTQKLLRVFGITAMPNLMKGEEDELRGDVWLANLNNSTARRLTFTGGYHSPLILPGAQSVWALRGEMIYEIPVKGGEAKEVMAIPGIVKLAGLDNEYVVLLRRDQQRNFIVELLSLADKRRTALPYDSASAEDARMLAYLRGWERRYDSGKFWLYTEAKEQGAGREVKLEETGRPALNVSHCGDGEDCGQPALASPARLVVFIKGPSVK